MQKSIEIAEVGPDGTVKLPEDVRKRAGIKNRTTLMFFPSNHGVILGKVNKKFLEATNRLIARKKKISQSEINDLIHKVRYGSHPA